MSRSKKSVFKTALDFEVRPMVKCLEKIAEQKQLLRLVRMVLPISIAEHAVHCVLKETLLLVYTDSAAWASQIRFYQEAILTKMQTTGRLKISRIQVKITQPVDVSIVHRAAQLPSHETVQAILSQVNEKSNDVLDLALANLAKTLLKRSKD